jgi:acid phosphatase type 7
MRIVADLFEKASVDIVFSGYVHCFERSRPLRFRLSAPRTGPVRVPETVLDGQFELDRDFDGRTVTKPNGPIYILTGAGGAPLHDAKLSNAPAAWLPFTVKHVSDRYSFSVLDVNGDELTFRQIAADGTELDNITVSKHG